MLPEVDGDNTLLDPDDVERLPELDKEKVPLDTDEDWVIIDWDND